MRVMVLAVLSLVSLTACGSRSSEPVGENSAGSIKTTAVGTIVGTEPSPTPTPTDDDATANAAE